MSKPALTGSINIEKYEIIRSNKKNACGYANTGEHLSKNP
jgi:hypothetical protein